MRRTDQIEFVGSAIIPITCPAGEEVRIVSVRVNVTPDAAGDQVTMAWLRDGKQVLGVATDTLLDTTTVIQASLGATATRKTLSNIDPITGDVTFDGADTQQVIGLPNVWLPWGFNFSVSILVGGMAAGIITYERRKQE